MPNIKSAKKRLRQSITARKRNMQTRTRVKNTRRGFMEAMSGEDRTAGETAYRSYCSVLDCAAKRGVIKKNTAIRRKKRAADKLRSLASPAPSSE